MSQHMENRPSLATETAPESVATHPQHTGITRTEAIERLTGAYAVLVAGVTVRKHLYFNLPAAQRAVARAEARGATAHLILVRLVPVDDRELDTVAGVIADAH